MKDTPPDTGYDQDLTSGIFILFLLLGMIVGGQIYFYRHSSEQITFTVARRERVTESSSDSVKSYYLVWSREGEVFEVTDDWAFLTWNSSDRYGQLQEGGIVNAKVAGWRVPFLSWYRNIVEVQSVKPQPLLK
jgi:hypothetical protein